MKVLICGGAGYIGSHIVREFTSYPSYEVIILDNFSKGHLESIPEGIKYEKADGIRSVCLRYFNACGAHESGKIGEDHDPESHLIPLILQVALGRREQI